MESQISQLKEDLKKVKDQLNFSELSKKQAQQDAKESKEQMLSLSVKLEDSQQQLLKLSDNSTLLISAISEIQQLKVQLELIANCENAHTQIAESSEVELLNLKHNLAESLSLVKNMSSQITEDPKLVNETLRRLEAAKRTVESLRADAAKAVHGYNSAALELEQSRARLNLLETLVTKFDSGLISNNCNNSRNFADNANLEQEAERLKNIEDPNHIEPEVSFLRYEVGRLRCGVESAQTKLLEEQIQNIVKMKNAHESIERIKSESSQKVSELEAELKRKEAENEELKANLMDKETELQGIVEENEKLNLKLEKSIAKHSRLNECVAELNSDLIKKERELQSISQDNEMLKMEIDEAVMKLELVTAEAEGSKQNAERLAEKLEVVQAAMSETDAEVRRLRVQSDQWRKAAEAAAATISGGNNAKLAERSMSLDSRCNPHMNRYSTCCEEIDDDFQRKKSGNMLKKFKELWKKNQN